MKRIKAMNCAVIAFTLALLLSSCGKSADEIYRVSLPMGESKLINDSIEDLFIGQTVEELMSGFIDASEDEHHGFEAAVAQRIILDDIGLCLPNDDERIIQLGITAHSVGTPGIRLKDDMVVSEDLIIQTTCRFICGGREYIVVMRTDSGADDWSFCKLDDLLVSEATVFGYDISFYGQYNGYIRKADKNRIYCCKVIYNDEPIYMTPVNGNFFDADDSDLITDSIFDFLSLFDFRVVRLKDYLK